MTITLDLPSIALSAMLTLSSPGNNAASRIRVAKCLPEDDCALPGFTVSRAKWSTFTREESSDEGMARWAEIALAAGNVAKDPPDVWAWRDQTGKLQALRAIVTIDYHESKFSRATQEGHLRGALGEVCGMQIRPVVARAFGFDPEELVGLDRESTERCFRAGLTVLAAMRKRVERQAECADALRYHWFKPAIAEYGSGGTCVPVGEWAEGVAARMRSYERTGARKALPVDAEAMLDLARSREWLDEHGEAAQ